MRKFDLSVYVCYHNIWMCTLCYFLVAKLWASLSKYLSVLVFLTGASLEKLYGPWRNISFVPPGSCFLVHAAYLKKYMWQSIVREVTESTNNGRLLGQSHKAQITVDYWHKVNSWLFFSHLINSHTMQINAFVW